MWGREATEAFCRALCTEAQWAEVGATGTTDFGVAHSAGERFRASVLRQRAGYAAVLRPISSEVLRFDQIGLPDTAGEWPAWRSW